MSEETKDKLENEKKQNELLKSQGIEAENMIKKQIQGLENDLDVKKRQLEEVSHELENEKHEHRLKLKNLQNELDDMNIELKKEKMSKGILEEQMQQLKADLDKGMTS